MRRATVSSTDGKTRVTVLSAVFFDLAAGSEFYAFYVPYTYGTDVHNHLARSYQKIIGDLKSGTKIISLSPGDLGGQDTSAMRFSGRVFIYYNDLLSIQQLGELDAAFRANGATVQLRGQDYATTRWLQEKAT